MIRFTTMMLAAFAVMITCAMAQGGTTPAQDTTTPPPQPKDSAATPIPMESTSTSGDKPNDGSSFGIKLMYGVGMLSYDPMPAGTTVESSPAYSAGLFWNHSGEGVISFGLQTELLYVSESGLLNMGSQFGESTVTTTSIRLPILLKLQFLDRNLIQPSVYAGPSIGYQLTATTKVGETETDVERINGFQYGLAVGIDATFLRIFVVDIRYNMNFSDIASADEVEATPDTSMTMGSLRFGLGLRF